MLEVDKEVFICIILLVLGVVPGLIYILVKYLKASHHVITFYKGKFVIRTGIIHTNETETIFKGVLSASVQQGLKGKIFKYGDVRVDVAGKNNLFLTGVKNPNALRDYLKGKQLEADTLNHVITD